MNIIFISQFRDCSGYAQAARGYLKALDNYLTDNPGAFNFRIHVVPVENSKTNRLTEEEESIISKYEFSSEEELDQFSQKAYTAVWQMPAPMVYFLRSDPQNPFWRSALRLIVNSTKNINISVWESDVLPDSWKQVYEQLNTESVIVPCEWNKKVYSEALGNNKCHLLPYVLDEKIVNSKSIPNMENHLKDKFVVFSMSQWNIRKGFDKLIKAYSMEFSGQEDTVLVIKTYLNLMEGYLQKFPMQKQAELIANEIKATKSTIYMPDGKTSNANIMLLTDTLPFNQLSWLYDQSDIFALLTRAEGYGLTVAESLLHETPVLVPSATGYMDFTHSNSAFFVEGHWSPYVTRPEYHCDMNWFEPHILSARKQLRRAYEMWKHDSLKEKGRIGRDHLLGLELDEKTIGQKLAAIIGSVAETVDNEKENVIKIPSHDSSKVSFLKNKINNKSTARERLDLLKDSFKGEECYLITCGPSLKEYTPEFLKEKLKDKLVIAIKQAYDYVPEIVDFHMFNCNNFSPYKYEKSQPIVLTAAGEPEEIIRNNVWTNEQAYDIFMPIINSNQDFNKALANTKEFDKYTLDKSVDRPWGPGMIYEVALFLLEHLGVSDVYTIGWDHEKIGQTKSTRYYDDKEVRLTRKSDPMRPDEIERNIELSRDFCSWLREKGVNVYIGTKGSHVHSDVPRKMIG